VGDPLTTVDYEFIALTEDTTYVVIKNYSFKEIGDELIQAIKDSKGFYYSLSCNQLAVIVR
jgi:hypothetical protein